MSKQAYYEGVEVTIRGEKYIFPGLSLAQLEENMGEIEEIQKLSEEDSMKMICKISRFLYLEPQLSGGYRGGVQEYD